MDLVAIDKDGDGSLDQAVSHGRLETVHLLSGAGADPNTENIHGHSALIKAAEEGRLDIVRSPPVAGADENCKRRYGSTSTTALHPASFQGHSEVVRLLIVAGADRQTTTVLYSIDGAALRQCGILRRRRSSAARAVTHTKGEPKLRIESVGSFNVVT